MTACRHPLGRNKRTLQKNPTKLTAPAANRATATRGGEGGGKRAPTAGGEERPRRPTTAAAHNKPKHDAPAANRATARRGGEGGGKRAPAAGGEERPRRPTTAAAHKGLLPAACAACRRWQRARLAAAPNHKNKTPTKECGSSGRPRGHRRRYLT